jgi:choline dehydrogenase-like flavoprotein
VSIGGKASDSAVDADVVIVGAGPAGIALGLKTAAAGLRTVLIESGGERRQDFPQTLAETPHFDPSRHAPMTDATRRQVGGASVIWGGRIVPYDPVDFDHRPHIAGSDWPVTFEAVEPYFAEASRLCFSGEPVFSSREIPSLRGETLVPGLPDGDVLTTSLERWSLPTNFGREYRSALKSTPGLRLVTELTAVEVLTSTDGRQVEAIRARRPDGGEEMLRARSYVLACGGLETTRLLLASDRHHRQGLGNHSDKLGRFYMGHISGKIANVQFTTDPSRTRYGYSRDPEGVYLRHRFSISRESQHRERLPNVVAWLANPPIADPAHGSGVLSFAYLALSSPVFGKYFVADAIRKANVGSGGRKNTWKHVANMLRDAPATAAFVPTFGVQRFMRRRRVPGFFVRSRSNCYPLHYHGEQVPNPESRVTLAEESDQLGLRKLLIDLRYSEQDVDGVLKAHEIWDDHLRRHGCGYLEYTVADRAAAVWEQAADGFHQAGTTRMSAHPDDGVVDSDLRVHGVGNLYVASGSVLPTSSQANTTFMIVVFALRLADHLAQAIPWGPRS